MDFSSFKNVVKLSDKSIFLAGGTSCGTHLKANSDLFTPCIDYSSYATESDEMYLIDEYNKMCPDNSRWHCKNVAIVQGATQAFSILISFLCQQLDNVIILTPAWSKYFDVCRQQNIEVKTIFPISIENLEYDVERIKKAITNKTKAIVYASPSNPLCKRIGKNTERYLFDLIEKSNINLIVDETYYGLQYKNSYSVLKFNDTNIKQLFVIRSMSKYYCGAGARIGYIYSSIDNIEIIKQIRSNQILSLSKLSVDYSIYLLKNVDLNWHKTLCWGKLKEVLSLCERRSGFSCFIPDSAFFLCMNIAIDGKTCSPYDIFVKTNITVRDCNDFGLKNYFRVNLCCKETTIALEKFEEMLIK